MRWVALNNLKIKQQLSWTEGTGKWIEFSLINDNIMLKLDSHNILIISSRVYTQTNILLDA